MRRYKQIGLKEREELYFMVQQGNPRRDIAQRLDRHASTIYRELKRNTVKKRLGYMPDKAHQNAKLNKARHKKKLDSDLELKKLVISRLQDGWSPETIAGKLRLAPSPLMVCYETIYQFVYSSEGLSLGLGKLLLRGRSRRRERYARKRRHKIIAGRVSIHERPAYINNRIEFGHYEADTVFQQGTKSACFSTLIERKSRYMMAFKNESKKTEVVIKPPI